jgi:hypothetical protein
MITNTKCKVFWCTENSAKSGYCNRHYLQIRRHNKILPILRNRIDPQEFEFYRQDCHIALYDKFGNKITYAIVDRDDYDKVSPYKFDYQGRRYVRISGKSNEGFIFLHQLILGGKWVDHKDGDTLNNRKSNLRFCDNQQNQFNSKNQIGVASKYKGVRVCKNRPNSYYGRIHFNGNEIHLGTFYNEEEAALAYNEAAKKYFGEFARLNEI